MVETNSARQCWKTPNDHKVFFLNRPSDSILWDFTCLIHQPRMTPSISILTAVQEVRNITFGFFLNINITHRPRALLWHHKFLFLALYKQRLLVKQRSRKDITKRSICGRHRPSRFLFSWGWAVASGAAPCESRSQNRNQVGLLSVHGKVRTETLLENVWYISIKIHSSLSRQETPNSVCERTPTRSEGKFARHL